MKSKTKKRTQNRSRGKPPVFYIKESSVKISIQTMMNNQLINYYFTPDYLLLQKGYTLNKFFKLQKTHSFFLFVKEIPQV